MKDATNYDLVIWDYDGEIKAVFPLDRTIYEVYENKLLVEYDEGLHTYRLDRYEYSIEKR
jgi:hypothetical protein